MNLAGKILVVALFIMSLMFATFSIMVYASHRNWREEIMRAAPVGNQDVGLKEQYNRKTTENEHLATQRNNLEEQSKNEKGMRIQDLIALEVMTSALKTEYATKAQELKTKETQLAANTVDLHKSEAELKELTSQVNQLRTQIAAAQDATGEQIKISVSLNDKLATARGQLAVLQERNDQLSSDVKQAKQRGGTP
jgi:chromosome segregation ATPase